MTIKTYDEVYNLDINNFIISIYVDEFGYEESRKELQNQDNNIYPKSGGNLWIAFNKKNEIIGTIALLKHSNHDIELKKFYVRNDYRGKSISKELYSTALDFCKINSFKRIVLGTYENLTTAVHFYLNRRF